MARSEKPGIRYFSIDVDILADRKVRRVLSACGPAAMAVILRLLCDIYGDRGYYAQADDDYFFDAADALGMETETVRGVALCCVQSGFFDAGMWERLGILTSRRVQRNFLDATRKRSRNNVILPEYLLLDEAEVSGESAAYSGESAETSGESTQTKLNKIKPKENKEDQINNGAGGGELIAFGPYVSLREEETQALKDEFGEAGLKRMAEMLSDYKAATGKRYASDYHAIRSWVVKRWREEQAGPARPSEPQPMTGKYSEVI